MRKDAKKKRTAERKSLARTAREIASSQAAERKELARAALKHDTYQAVKTAMAAVTEARHWVAWSLDAMKYKSDEE
jgi:hypothetical protein